MLSGHSFNRSASDCVAGRFDDDVLARPRHLANPNPLDGSGSQFPPLLLLDSLLRPPQCKLGQDKFSEFHNRSSPLPSRLPLVGRHAVLTDVVFVEDERRVLQGPLYNRQIIVDRSIEPCLQGQDEDTELRTHVLHSLLARTIALRVICRRISRHGPTCPQRLDSVLDCNNGRLAVRLDDRVPEAEFLHVLHDALDDPLVGQALAGHVVREHVASRLIFANDDLHALVSVPVEGLIVQRHDGQSAGILFMMSSTSVIIFTSFRLHAHRTPVPVREMREVVSVDVLCRRFDWR